ncbi:hypothetical protein KFE94_02400 [bacterium SCSIO 12643]|nr:hypothetical protein KFE94_02400 [bacterium SCSIO 12643]
MFISSPAWTQKSDSSKTKSKAESGFKKELKKIEKAISFKNLIHHFDSVRMVNRFIHEQHQLTKGRQGYPYNVKHEDIPLKVTPYQPDSIFALDYEVLGWYPYWEDSLYKNLNYSLLSTIAYFSYEVDPATGKPTTIHDWKTSPVIDSAHAHQKDILLTVTNFSEANNRQFLTNSKSVQNCITEIKSLLKFRSGNGVCIDFEGIAKSEKEDFSKFITLLHQELKQANKDYKIYITIPAVDWQGYLNIAALIPVVDQFVIMGYGYYGSTSTVAGPVAPLHSGKEWEHYNLTTSVDYYLGNNIPESKLILALPYYGVIWETENGNLGSKVKSFIGNRTLDYIQTYVDTFAIQYDTVSQSAWCSYVVNSDQSQYRQCWFDDDSTLAIKLNYIKSKKLKGMGIWALGYDQGYHKMWKSLANNFTNTKIIAEGGVTPTHTDSLNADSSMTGFMKTITQIETVISTVTNYKTVLLYTLSFVVFFGGVGLVISMFQPNTRIFFFGNTAYTIYYTATILLFLIVILRWTNIITDQTILFFLGFVLGSIAMYIVNRIIKNIDNNRP